MNITPEKYAEILANQANMKPTGNLRRMTPMTPIEQSPAKVAKTATAALPESKKGISAKQGGPLELSPCPDMKVRRRNNQYEFLEQREYFAAIDRAVERGRHGADMIYAVTNSNVAGVRIGVKLVKSGLRKGYPDINIDVPMASDGVRFHGLRIEMKRADGVPSDVSKEQRQWHERLKRHGYKVVVCFGCDQALAVTMNYLGWRL